MSGAAAVNGAGARDPAAAAKAALRRRARAARARAHAARGAEASAEACAHLLEALRPHAGHPVSGYWPIRTEVDPRPAMGALAALGPVALPVVVGAAPLAFRRWRPGDPLVPGAFGAPIPEADERLTPRVLIVPLLAFTRAGGRLGYGGGHYDRTLAAARARGPVLAVGLAFAAQEVEAIPLEPTDQPLDMVVTEAGAIRP